MVGIAVGTIEYGQRFQPISIDQCICKFPNAQFTSSGNGTPISSNGTITGSGKSHFQNCFDRSFSSFSGSGACSVTKEYVEWPSAQFCRPNTYLSYFTIMHVTKNTTFLAVRAIRKALPLSSFERNETTHIESTSGMGPSEGPYRKWHSPVPEMGPHT